MEKLTTEQLRFLKGETCEALHVFQDKAGIPQDKPLFHDWEIEKAELIINALEGMTIDSAKELLAKIPSALEQLCKISKL